MKLLKRTNQKRRRGAALVEAAVVLPLLLLIVMGIIEFGRAMMVVQLVTNGAREGARLAIFDGQTNATVRQSVRTSVSNSVGCAETDITVDFTITPDPANSTTGNEISNSSTGDLITVDVSIPYSAVGYVNTGFLSTSNLSAKTTMRRE